MKVPKIPQRRTPGFVFSNAKRALLEGIADREFGASEQEKALLFLFTDKGRAECIFCGDSFERWDHLVSISKGGDTKIGNMVPACGRCDDSKQDNDFEEWMRGNAPKSPNTLGICDLEGRISRIKRYVSEHKYKPQRPRERLYGSDHKEFKALQADLDELFKRMKAFIDSKKSY